MEVKEILQGIGLKEKQADIYLACLELGAATAQDIAKKAEIKRTYFYDLAEGLLDQGLLVQTKKGKKRYFIAVDSDKLKAMEEKKLKLLDSALSELKSIFNTKGAKPRITFYEGINGIKKINDDTLNYKGEFVGFTTDKFLTADNKKFGKEAICKRVDKGINVRMISGMSNEAIDSKKRDKEELRETRILPANIFRSDIEFIIYANKVALVNYKEEFGLIIESKCIAKPLKMIFEIIWRGGFVV